MLINLVSNFIKYGEENGCICIGFYDMDGNIFIEVVDNGLGIFKKYFNYVFDCFYWVDKSCFRECGGLGLGLFIVKYIIEVYK